jgi:DNA-binding response OmpR family regulator
MRILLVEDNARLRDLLGECLRDANYSVDLVENAREFRDAAAAAKHSLYIIDLGLPDGDGIDLVEALRKSSVKAPILVVTARAGVHDRVSGLDYGADDYLVKPFHHLEFIARVRALLRRPFEMRPFELQAGGLVLNETSGQVLCLGQRVELRPSEQRLLALMMRRNGEVVPREMIENNLSDLTRELSPNAIDQLVSRLRKAIGMFPSGLKIRTIKGIGYALEQGTE